DVTNNGLREEYERAEYELKKIRKPLIVLPGNHDVRNVGYELFEDFIGPLNGVYEFKNGVLIWVDSTIPDLSDGRIGKHKFRWLKKRLEEYSDRRIKIVAAHHHLIPLPSTGRERNVLFNAGDVLDLLVRNDVTLYMCGHKHVPNVYRVEDIVVDNAGCASCRKTRRGDVNSYNIVTVHDDGKVEVTVRRVTGDERKIEHRPIKPKLFIPRGRRLLRIVQLSESRVSDRVYFRRKTLENVINMINRRLKPDIVVHNGNVVDMGIERNFREAARFWELIEAPKVVVPGPSDMTYLGYELFPEYFGEPEPVSLNGFTLIPVLTPQYETEIGVVGRFGQRKLDEELENAEGFRIVFMHHNPVPIPKSREMGFLEDAGDVLKLLTDRGTELVLTGHGGNSFAVKIEETIVVNAGSVSWELHRNPFGNSFNLIDIYPEMLIAFEVQATWGSRRLLGVWKLKGSRGGAP
ncbi:metallophosphoesterase, partial [Thermococcus sp.]|uniref:metallophosphoesterase family protein n=1 Tax=Thermococcus sp. TaxID=35749 RepID=UPI0026082239